MICPSQQITALDCLVLVFEFLTPNELGRSCIAFSSARYLVPVQNLWREHCERIWKLTFGRRIPSFYDGMTIFPHTWPICNDLMLPSENFKREGLLSVQYIGSVGHSNRCVRASTSFYPLQRNSSVSFILWLLKQIFGNSFIIDSPPPCFSTPYLSPSQGLNLGLRSVAYYEILISTESEIETEVEQCVAIGLSTEQFSSRLSEIMPGWDAYSYGYHGDDGAIFHGRGDRYAEYGPTFGPGDVVGCGVLYDRNAIFFTLNGTYLGCAFWGVEGVLYPTVGIDAKGKIDFNFGEKEFLFPIETFAFSEWSSTHLVSSIMGYTAT